MQVNNNKNYKTDGVRAQADVWLRAWQHSWPSLWIWLPGMLLWGIGAAINIDSDYHLLHLRHTNGPGIHLPTAGLFDAVSGANLFGEVLEWVGYAIACQHVAAYSFALFTFCNLAPRALAHHRDYQNRFGALLPPTQRALIPYVF